MKYSQAALKKPKHKQPNMWIDDGLSSAIVTLLHSYYVNTQSTFGIELDDFIMNMQYKNSSNCRT